jgi:hypothetical protein
MKGRIWGRPVMWIRVGIVVAAVAVLVLDGGGAAQAAAPSGITLAGFTSQNLPSFFKITGDGRRLTVGSIALNMTCTSGSQVLVPDVFARVPISANGMSDQCSAGPVRFSDTV